MLVIPAIDVKEGVVVQAFKGFRESYKPVESVLCDSREPLDVAKKFAELGFKALYVADLDSIMYGKLNLKLYEELGKLPVKVMLDAGVSTRQGVEKLLRCGVSQVVIGTEGIVDVEEVKEIFNEFDNNVALSLDLKEDKIISLSPLLCGKRPNEALKELINAPIKDVLLIDLAKVGSFLGIDLKQVMELKSVLKDGRLFVGGGVRGLDDILMLKRVGVDGVLVASALHRGLLKVSELKEMGLI